MSTFLEYVQETENNSVYELVTEVYNHLSDTLQDKVEQSTNLMDYLIWFCVDMDNLIDKKHFDNITIANNFENNFTFLLNYFRS